MLYGLFSYSDILEDQDGFWIQKRLSYILEYKLA